MAEQSKSLELYYRIQHVLGECAVDGHTCDYDSGGSDKNREKKASALILADKQAYALEVLDRLRDVFIIQAAQLVQLDAAEVIPFIDQAIQKINQDLGRT